MTQDPLPPVGLYDWNGRRHDPDLNERIAAAHHVMDRARRNGSQNVRNSPQDATTPATPPDGTRPRPKPQEAAS